MNNRADFLKLPEKRSEKIYKAKVRKTHSFYVIFAHFLMEIALFFEEIVIIRSNWGTPLECMLTYSHYP